jgi:hypothetical protein
MSIQNVLTRFSPIVQWRRYQEISALSDHEVLQGCVYVVSAINQRVIRKIGDFEETTFGSHSAPMSRLKSCNFVKKGIESDLVTDIEEKSVGEIYFLFRR